MLQPVEKFVKKSYAGVYGECRSALSTIRTKGPGQLTFWLLALVIGVAAGAAALGFRVAISEIQGLLYGADDHTLATTLGSLDWKWVVGIPILGGLAVGLILWAFTPDGQARAVSDVIDGAAMHEGRVSKRIGLASAAAALITLSTGGSSGREGPVVHLAAVISSWVSNRIHADGITARDLMGCAVAAAVSASFNAPLAGTIFALEVVLRHFAVHAFAPIVIASVAGTVVSRLQMGNVTEFILPVNPIALHVELPAFLMLGIVSGLVAFVLIRSIFLAEDWGDAIQKYTRLPSFLRPAVAGAMLGGIALMFPHIIGVGYETTSSALTGQLLMHEAFVFAIIKVVAIAITFAGRMGGGVFSPSLMLGALTGLTFGLVATSVFPGISGSETIYALAGMAAVAAAVLGAPISTTLIVFEMTGDWQAGIAVMVSVSLSSALTSRLVDRSFFLTQLERRGVHLAAGPQEYLLSTISVRNIMHLVGSGEDAPQSQCQNLIDQGAYVDISETLETAMAKLEASPVQLLPVVKESESGPELIGTLYLVDALRSYNRALAATAQEEHS
ncbi:voltage-gated chloride channel [Rhodobacterales bacterium 52_120_T64]|nr:voltage-gated chloride channel [Rhodobacterales bacterium 52_120_T64]